MAKDNHAWSCEQDCRPRLRFDRCRQELAHNAGYDWFWKKKYAHIRVPDVAAFALNSYQYVSRAIYCPRLADCLLKPEQRFEVEDDEDVMHLDVRLQSRFCAVNCPRTETTT